MCFMSFLDCPDLCVPFATCEYPTCSCSPGYHGDGTVKCSKGDVLHIQISQKKVISFVFCHRIPPVKTKCAHVYLITVGRL